MQGTTALRYSSTPISGEKVTSGVLQFVTDIFSVDASPLRYFGHDLDTVTFGWWQGDDLVANISLFPRQLHLAGVEVSALGIQSVGTRQDYRRQGLFTDLIQKVLAYADARLCPIVFTTHVSHLYLPWGFRHVQECAFAARVASSSRNPRYRRLDLGRHDDVALIKAGFARRTPTSLVASTRDHPSALLMSALTTPGTELLHLPHLDAIVAVRGRDSGSMILLDLVAAVIPPLNDIVSALGYAGTRVMLHLTPDLLSATYDEVANPYPTPLLVRGEFKPEGEPLMLSRMRV